MLTKNSWLGTPEYQNKVFSNQTETAAVRAKEKDFYCPKCGRRASLLENFCPICGARTK